jgi:hypothetical protein
VYVPWEVVFTVVVAGDVLTLAPEICALVLASVTVPLIVPVVGVWSGEVIESSGLSGLLQVVKNIRIARIIKNVFNFI